MSHHGPGFWSIPFCACSLAIACVTSGCGSASDGPKVSPVSGVITVDGAPLPKAGVAFHPDTAKGNTAKYLPAGTADDKGRYELVTATKQGAPPGWYKVVVSAPVPARTGGEAPKVGPPPFNAKYADPATTDLNIEVKDGAASGSYDVKVTK